MLREQATIYRPEEEILSGIRQNGGWVNAHAHFDRAFSITPQSYKQSTRALREKWDIIDDLKRESTVEQIYERMAQATELMIEQGVQAVGTFIDVDPVIKDKAIRAADRVRIEYRDHIRLVFINQVLKGVIDPEAHKFFIEGAEFADIVGGLPKKDIGREQDHIDIVLETAKSQGKMVHVHVDQYNDPNETETELLIKRTKAMGMQGKVVAIHCVSLAAHPKKYRSEIYREMIDAEIIVVSCPTAWIDSERNETEAVTHNSIAPAEEMMQEGIPVALGTDNIYDVYKPFSDGKMWDEMRLLQDTCRIRDKDVLVRIATDNGLLALGIPKSGLVFPIDK